MKVSLPVPLDQDQASRSTSDIPNHFLALRLYPVFPQMNRVSLTDTTLPVGGGSDGNSPIYVPKGTMFDTSYYVLHRLHSIWGPDAETFDPDRWDRFKPGAWEFLPFGAGPRGYVYTFRL